MTLAQLKDDLADLERQDWEGQHQSAWYLPGSRRETLQWLMDEKRAEIKKLENGT